VTLRASGSHTGSYVSHRIRTRAREIGTYPYLDIAIDIDLRPRTHGLRSRNPVGTAPGGMAVASRHSPDVLPAVTIIHRN
jgi:hypothetical protein